MSRNAAHGRKAADNRPGSRRSGRIPATAGAFALALGLTPAVAPEAAAQSNSGIYINNDVLNSLGPGPEAAPFAPLAPAAPPTPLSPYGAPASQTPAMMPAAGSGGLGFQPYGTGNFVVTRPGTLLFPPLQAPTSTLTPGFAGAGDSHAANHAARTQAFGNAFAEGPEPSSQLLIPLQGPGYTPGGAPASSSDSVIVFMDNLPPADPNADPASAPVLVLSAPPQPAPRKPEVPAEMLADWPSTPADEALGELAPEFAAAPLPEPPAIAELPPEPVRPQPVVSEPVVSKSVLAEPAETPLAEPTASEPVAAEATAAQPSGDATPAPDLAEAPAPAPAMPEAGTAPVSLLPAEASLAQASAPEVPPSMASPGAAPAAAMPPNEMPGNEMNATPSGLQTASLSVGSIGDTSLLFEVDSAELSPEVQSELRSLAEALRGDAGAIQVLGFAGLQAGDGAGGEANGQSAVEDQARKLALSRALKVRSFLIDAGIPSTRIRVRSLGDRVEGGPANRVDIKPIGS